MQEHQDPFLVVPESLEQGPDGAFARPASLVGLLGRLVSVQGCRDNLVIFLGDLVKQALRCFRHAFALEFLDFDGTWNAKYPMIRKSWETHWEDLVEFFKYPQEIRKIIYTTNAIESLNFSLRKITKNRAAFPTDDSIYKIMYLAINKASKKWTMPISNWGAALNQFSIMFEGRVKL